ncbi:MAG TPA: hypothetical protein VL307_06640 [Chitinophagaceae bacterium]|nr:hypothetical protein [Chitinophagaceae bacterium]
MDLNNLDLNAALLTDLYRMVLVEKPGAAPKAAEKPAKAVSPVAAAIPFLGKNQQQICIVVNYATDVYLPDEQLNFLTAVLQACKLNLGDVAIVNQHRASASFTQLQSQLGCTRLLLMGVDSTTLGLPAISFFSIEQVADCAIVQAPPAEQLNTPTAEGKQLKSKLWNCLKQLFNV